MTFSLAVPNKGRLKDPSVQLLADAGLSFELTDRALSVPVRNIDMELLFVRTEDIPELVSDGVADVGITGTDLVAEHGNGLETIVDLGYGHCRLVAAVPASSEIEKTDEFSGMRVATAHPNATARYFADRGIDVDVIALRGSVEVATKIGVADAIVDLVSTGSTLRVNGLRAVGTLIESQAILVGRAGETDRAQVRQVATAFRAVTAGRLKRYLLLNAPATATDVIAELIPGLEAPTVVPLAEDDWVAIHSVVDAEHIWELLPRLEAAGGKGILVLPIEQLL
ncbi:MAG: ATP phosphoribosyltransferase [Acidimicrobiia bacterium]|nr:ATP phosphoribosyltransferase [Acidimicrobiia bacterium]MDH4308170.1 ATP phosphoribosyltransferase [Acidimicrobiia bacterium]MDH5292633.1 ATP phosphoribosyltransferase [Acidimicrobiia bacterium]